MICTVQARWEGIEPKSITRIAQEFSLSNPTAQKYIQMTEEEIAGLDAPIHYKKRKTVMDDYLNIIYKMLRDKRHPATIMAYVIKKGYDGNLNTLDDYVKLLAKNNFNIRFARNCAYTFKYPDDVIVIKRNELLKYITTKNPKLEKDGTIALCMDIVKEKYHIVAVLETVYNEFHEILMGDNPDRLDDFVHKYEGSAIGGFVDGIKRDITPVKNAISHDESSGFVEGNNNKFKLIKRILYGRANLVNLFRKCYVAFQTKPKDFDLSLLLKTDAL